MQRDKEFDLVKMLRKYEGNKIALYGLGIETKKVLTKLGKQFDIIGLLDGYREEGCLYGKRIISFQEAVDSGVKLILVVARPGSCKAIARRIKKECMEHQIELKDIRGVDLCTNYEPCYDLKKAQGITKRQLLEKIAEHDVLSVDLFDTLIIRNTLFYTDIFDIMSIRLADMGISIEDFSRKRIDAEKTLAASNVLNLEEIYGYMTEQYHLNMISADELAQLEWEIDYDMVVSREAICDLLDKVYQSGKVIYIVSDSYYNRKQIEKLLEKCGIDFYTNILISCEYSVDKRQGLFGKLKERLNGKTCLHIGDDSVADIDAAMRNGIEGCRIYSGIDLLEAAGYFGMWEYITSLSDRIKVGMFVARLFNNPFQFESEERKIEIDEDFSIGYLLMAPIIADFVLWFREQIEKNKLNNIWFCARDGYLIKMLYDALVKNDESVYFLVSRMAAVRAGIEDEEDIEYIEQMKFSGSLLEELEKRFGILLKDDDCVGIEGTRLLDYSHKILDNARVYRQNYLTYINGLKKDDNDIVFFDFAAKGTVQLFMQKLVLNHFKGIYFLQLEKENMGGKDLDIISFYDTSELDYSAIYNNYYILETVLTSDQPSVTGFDAEGSALYAKETRSKSDIECSKAVQMGIWNYFSNYLKLCPKKERSVNKQLDEIMLELIHRIEIKSEEFRQMKVEDPFFNRNTEMRDLL